MKNRIVFLLPQAALQPIGGFKVVFEYANRLVRDGLNVTLVYPNTLKKSEKKTRTLLKDITRYIIRKINKDYTPKRWFKLDKRIEHIYCWTLDSFTYHKNDLIIATAVNTAIILNQYKIDSKNKFYFIQGYENWFVSEDLLISTYHYPFKKIVISTWLQDILQKYSEQSVFIPNGFDFNFFKCSREISERNPFNIAYMYHVDKIKGVNIAMEAFHIVKQKYPGLKVTMFSAYDKPSDLPEWMDFHQKPDKALFNKIYNDAAIYVGSSHVEGWGLTIGEAMQCGCAIACTNNKGYLEMAKDGETALVSPVGDAQKLAENIARLISNSELRCRIAEQGHEFIQQFDVEKSYLKFKKLMEESWMSPSSL